MSIGSNVADGLDAKQKVLLYHSLQRRLVMSDPHDVESQINTAVRLDILNDCSSYVGRVQNSLLAKL